MLPGVPVTDRIRYTRDIPSFVLFLIFESLSMIVYRAHSLPFFSFFSFRLLFETANNKYNTCVHLVYQPRGACKFVTYLSMRLLCRMYHGSPYPRCIRFFITKDVP